LSPPSFRCFCSWIAAAAGLPVFYLKKTEKKKKRKSGGKRERKEKKFTTGSSLARDGIKTTTANYIHSIL
jgi:hypothetical protein